MVANPVLLSIASTVYLAYAAKQINVLYSATPRAHLSHTFIYVL